MTIINPLNTELNPICHLLTLLGARHILHVNGLRVNTPKLEAIRVKKAQLDAQLILSIFRQPLHVSGVSIAHHQEVQPYVYSNWYLLFFLDDCWWNIPIRTNNPTRTYNPTRTNNPTRKKQRVIQKE